MADASTRATQEMLRAAGYDITVDGKDGPATATALGQYNASRAATESKKADADKAQADARAAEAQANARATEAAAESKRLDAADKARSDAARATESARGYDTAIMTATYAGGFVVGTGTAVWLDKKLDAGLVNKNKQLVAAAKDLAPLLKKLDPVTGVTTKAAKANAVTRMAAVVGAADKTGVTKPGRGFAGPLAGGGMIAFGAASRYLATQTDNETLKTVLNASGTGEMVAGGIVVVKDLASRAAAASTLNVKALSVVEQARALSAAPVVAAASNGAKMAAAGTVAKVAGKVALKALGPVAAVMAVMAAVAMFKSSAEAGENKAVSVAKAVAAGADAMLTGGIVTAMVQDPYVQSEMAKQQAQPRGARGSAPSVTVTEVPDHSQAVGLPAKAAEAGDGKKSAVSAARKAMAQIDAKRSAGEQRTTNVQIGPSAAPGRLDGGESGAASKKAAQKPVSDGMADAYTRVRNGITEQVSGYHIQPRRG